MMLKKMMAALLFALVALSAGAEEKAAHFLFARPGNIFLSGDPLEAKLRLPAAIIGELRLEIRDHRGNMVDASTLKAAAEQAVALPGGRLGWFEIRLALPGGGVLRESYAVLPPYERLRKRDSIFGGVLGPGGKKTLETLDWMEWIGMSAVRRAHGIASPEVWVPDKPKRKIFSVAETERILGETHRRGIEPVPLTTDARRYPAGTFRVAEGTGGVNARRLPVDYAEELKIEYARTRLHDRGIYVASGGVAGVDLAWLDGLGENGGWDYFDLLQLNLYCFPRAPEVNGELSGDYWLHDRVTQLQTLMLKYGARPVYDGENGYLAQFPERRVENFPLAAVSSPSTVAAYLVRSYLQSIAYGLSKKMWYTVDGSDGFGLIEEGRPRPGYPAYAAMTWMLDGAEYVGELLPREEQPADAPPRFLRAFRNSEGAPLLVGWAALYRQNPVTEAIDTPAWQGEKPGVPLLWDGTPAQEPPAPLETRFRVGVHEVEVADLMGNHRKVATPGGILTLPLDDYPVFIFGAAPELLVEAEKHSLQIFTDYIAPNDLWRPLIQAVLPAEGVHPPRNSFSDQENRSAELVTGKPYQVHVRLSNVGWQADMGEITLELPEGWTFTPRRVRFTIAPGKEKEVVATFTVTPDRPAARAKVISHAFSGRLGELADSVMNVSVSDVK